MAICPPMSWCLKKNTAGPSHKLVLLVEDWLWCRGPDPETKSEEAAIGFLGKRSEMVFESYSCSWFWVQDWLRCQITSYRIVVFWLVLFFLQGSCTKKCCSMWCQWLRLTDWPFKLEPWTSKPGSRVPSTCLYQKRILIKTPRYLPEFSIHYKSPVHRIPLGSVLPISQSKILVLKKPQLVISSQCLIHHPRAAMFLMVKHICSIIPVPYLVGFWPYYGPQVIVTTM